MSPEEKISRLGERLEARVRDLRRDIGSLIRDYDQFVAGTRERLAKLVASVKTMRDDFLDEIRRLAAEWGEEL